MKLLSITIRILFLLLFGFVGGYCWNELLAPASTPVEAEPDSVIAITPIRGLVNIRSVVHNGHLFVVLRQDAIIHHPSCPCLTVKP